MTCNSELHTWIEKSYETSKRIWPDVPTNEWWSVMVPAYRLTGLDATRSDIGSNWHVSMSVGDRAIPINDDSSCCTGFCDDFRLGEELSRERVTRLVGGLENGQLYRITPDGSISGQVMYPLYMPFDFLHKDAEFGNPHLIATDGSRFRLSDVILLEGTATPYGWFDSPPMRCRDKYMVRALLESGWVTLYEADHDRNIGYGRSLYDLVVSLALYGDDDTLEFYTVPDEWYGDNPGVKPTA